MEEIENVQQNVKFKKQQYVETEYLKNEKNVIIEQKIIEKIKNVLKNVLATTQHILIVEIELLITMKTALTVK
ncbi:hypothetical protein IKN40_00400 [bacterium]|nr:hypothetical protein [bacterium]